MLVNGVKGEIAIRDSLIDMATRVNEDEYFCIAISSRLMIKKLRFKTLEDREDAFKKIADAMSR